MRPITAEDGDKAARLVLDKLSRTAVHQFDNTSLQSRIRNKRNADDGRRLEEDGANLAPFLYRLQINEPKCYRRILDTLQLILPFFKSFELQPEYGHLLLRWHEQGSDRTFSASQAGDGMLRAMALVALLQQPEADLPNVLIRDEPELGLHPYAIEVLAALIQSASLHTQVIVATQSVSLLDRFEPHDIIPYLQLHEFEALLFSDVAKFEGVFPGESAAIQQLIAIRGEFPTPEHINDRPNLSPSKRILQVLPDYRKPVAGPLIVQQIGLPTLRRECEHFNQWIVKIEKAVSQ